MKYLREAIRAKPDLCEAHLGLGRILADQGKLQDAEKEMREAVRLNPTNPMGHRDLGLVLYRGGQWKSAIEALEEAVKRNAGGIAYDWFYLAMAQWRLEHKDEARRSYDRAVKLMDANAPAAKELLDLRVETEELLGLKNK
jgi:Tfp pilus assembly protein PilF